jgi:hypothetical protein
MSARQSLKWMSGAVVVALIAIQLVPVERTNPPVDGEVPAPPEVREVLRRAWMPPWFYLPVHRDTAHGPGPGSAAGMVPILSFKWRVRGALTRSRSRT